MPTGARRGRGLRKRPAARNPPGVHPKRGVRLVRIAAVGRHWRASDATPSRGFAFCCACPQIVASLISRAVEVDGR
eukprot:3417162-Rhodomonas_salina.1